MFLMPFQIIIIWWIIFKIGKFYENQSKITVFGQEKYVHKNAAHMI